ncbi:unnamed protein product, partial [Timema podura]|nr:unnamed protein product [Timema podura]
MGTLEPQINKRNLSKKSKESLKSTVSTETKEKKLDGESIPIKYGPMPTFPYQRVWTRAVLILGVLSVIYFGSKDGNEIAFAKQKEILRHRAQDVVCSDSYRTELEQFPGCVPERCGRVVFDQLVSGSEADALLKIAQQGLALGGSEGGASILDLHSGALSQGKNFVNIYKLDQAKGIFRKSDFIIYNYLTPLSCHDKKEGLMRACARFHLFFFPPWADHMSSMKNSLNNFGLGCLTPDSPHILFSLSPLLLPKQFMTSTGILTLT